MFFGMASRLPMRNWNWTKRLQLERLPDASRLPMRNWNYSGLSLSHGICPLPDYLWGIETDLDRVKIPAGGASRLPMRNWNILCDSSRITRSNSLPDYLWGIETLWQPSSRASRQWLPDYLWGIETGTTSGSNYELRFSLPDYLWGIETEQSRARVHRPGASRLPMRNWN